MAASDNAPGGPGRPGRWTTGAKSAVGTALTAESPLWFTLSHGILNEVYYPFVDSACIRDLQLLITDRHDFFAEEKRDTHSAVEYLAAGVPAFRVINTCKQGRFRIEKIVFADPRRPTMLQQVRFVPLQGTRDDYALFVLLAPQLDNQGAGNTGWVGDFKGQPMLFAERDGRALALACSAPWRRRSAGYVGTSDGWQDIAKHKEMRWTYARADNGTVALTGEIDLGACDEAFLLALGFGHNDGHAGHRARAAILDDFAALQREYTQGWSDWQKVIVDFGASGAPRDLLRTSAMVMRIHESKNFPGGIVASLAVPWGESKGDQDLGYHRIWPRDMIETVTGQLAAQKHQDARRVLFYFMVTQDADGHWPQNMFVDGRHSWDGIQLDETAFVLLLVDMARRHRALNHEEYLAFWPMVWRAVRYLVQHGPVTAMDRWEELPGYFASTLAVEIPALLAAADLADACGAKAIGAYLRETADAWNDDIERLIYVRDTELARQCGVDGYYVRFARPDQRAAATPAAGETDLHNHGTGACQIAVAEVISPDALTLVRFGLRAADDPRIVNTVRVIDRTLKVETPGGPCWHRYTRDGYGEHADGSAFDGSGIGRAWPLLTGERAHYELAAGHHAEAERLRDAMASCANECGLLPEQVWDTNDIPQRELYLGRPSGSAMPLVWAHAEYVKLCRSLHDGRVFDLPQVAAQRYLHERHHSPHIYWRLDQPCRAMPPGKLLRVELPAAATVHWSSDGWKATTSVAMRDTGLGIHVADLPTRSLGVGALVHFTIRWAENDRWEGRDFSVQVAGESATVLKKSMEDRAAKTPNRESDAIMHEV